MLGSIYLNQNVFVGIIASKTLFDKIYDFWLRDIDLGSVISILIIIEI